MNMKILTMNIGVGATRIYSGVSSNTIPALTELRFGDFDGDGATDVFSKFGDQWRYASRGEYGWIDLNSSSIALDDLRFGDFNGDGKTDVFSISSGNEMRYSSGGVSNWIYLDSSYMLFCETQYNYVKPLFVLEESIDKIADFIKGEFPAGTQGIICLQEVNTNISGMNVLDSIKNKLGGTWDYTFYSPIGTTYGVATMYNLVPTKEQLWALPREGNSEKRGAIALKFNGDSNYSWVVNTHLGLSDAEREAQVDTIVSKYQTFDTLNASVIIVGDFNIIDTERLGSSFTATVDQVTHYNNNIGDLINSGMNKLEYMSTESHPYSFHSWNGNSNSKILDYIFYRDPAANVPEVSNLTPGPFDAEIGCTICPDYLPDNRYLSDHNGLVLEYPVFNF
ncbi:endonuclease/exonuclease/phosphatase family protein [uncultured Draconibacterium sp.]|uniref:endonuclease/exonuclease/phosphatase family protein n=1 Tax=uncultured Draconibacterium sp. TaxID=1573823 RepID=UPI0029C9A7D0|nr:endonuclease/exonuclease/phosphatase family protein [uncultured Draconibacterium sp.]